MDGFVRVTAWLRLHSAARCGGCVYAERDAELDDASTVHRGPARLVSSPLRLTRGKGTANPAARYLLAQLGSSHKSKNSF